MIRAANWEHEAEAIGDALARAFHDDPVIGWLLPDGKGVAAMFVALARHIHAITDVAGDISGAAIWDPPGHRPDEEAGIPALIAAMGDRAPYGMTLDETMARHRPEQPHWYLAQIGTVPEVQGTGVGGALMREGLARCDGPVYLESSKESNIPFYQRHGFEVTSRFTLPDGPPVWGMWRPAP
ncbi:GNAT family N-acetyltransferase [Nonomuraea sp. PA05]|uniref:GNAT family N-acetyltransferase n=1 Tax=Nonomuraea sp. PA05 TaxID=2604466 RepID=UPI0011DADD8F|nr:GNAT family N-acetyltransferase [Nonomuraea sp. PA05]TYB67123.1 GNAT family N-acetyltransferase [Nonomuraea sp. PA05]